ncbi:alpha-amylase family glycosyl hydrolase [Bifidobacterium minimum]|nr:alpha-amylase family glycosyl hydrolase [Bifidobacterium minimum]
MTVQRLNSMAGKLLGMGVALAMLAGGGAVVGPLAAQASPTKDAQNQASITSTSKDVQVIAFQQTWNTIAKECTQTYGPEGVGYVEVSPPQESIQGTQWWTSYQPVSYKLDSKLGTADEFKTMISTCKAAGVGIIADVVLNQTTGADTTTTDASSDTQTGVAGTTYNPATGDYPGFTGSDDQYTNGITSSDFHDCTTSISDYTNQTEVQECRLSGMWDFNSSSTKVRDIQSDYLASLYKLGVAGFRVDAAKHINTDDLKAIKAEMAIKVGKSASDIYWIQETIGNSSEASGIQPSNYTQNGDVTEFGFKSEMNENFKGKISNLKGLSSRLIDSDSANVFVTNWDTARSEGALTYKDGARYQLANAFMLSYGYGTARLISDYKFSASDDGAPGATATSVPDVDMDTACSTNTSDWNCEQRWTSTRGLIAFHNYVGDAALTDWQDDGGNNIAYSRGSKGFVAINNDTSAKDVSYTTSLPDGEYCNVYSVLDCSQTVTVSGGKVTTTIPARSAIALYAGATKASHPSSSTATDPSDPTLSDESDTVSPDDTTLTVYYKPTKSWSTVYMHYGIGDTWTTAPGVKMNGPDSSGYYSLTIDTGGKAVQICFNDGDNHWDSNNNNNYTAPAGIIQAGVTNGSLSYGNPENLTGQTRVVVHYKAADGDPGRGVYVWGSNTQSGDTLAGAYHAFTGTDCWGKVYEQTFDGVYDDIGLIVTTSGWDKYGGDRKVTVGSDGTVQVWIDGTSSDGESTTLTEAPSSYDCKATDVTVKVHYYRSDGLYFNASDTSTTDPQWDLWTWSSSVNGFSASFTSHDDWGAVASYDLTDSVQVQSIGLLRRYGKDEWKSKDPDDRNYSVPSNAIVPDSNGKATAEVWLVQGDSTVYTARPSTGLSVKSAEISGFTELTAKLSKSSTADALDGKVSVTDADGKAVDVKSIAVSGTALTITTANELSVTGKYTVTVKGFGTADAVAGSVVRTDAFDDRYAYDGDDLGATWTADATTLKVWAPTATSVELVVYKSDRTADAGVYYTSPMTRGDKGVWSVTLNGRQSEFAYTYRLTFADGTTNDSADPYATASVVNGQRSVVLPTSSTTVAGSTTHMASFGSATNATIAEMNIRDFSIAGNSGISAAKRGKYLGVVESGTTTTKGATSGLDYLKNLGVSHVQIMPMFDYGSTDEASDTSYDAKKSDGSYQQNWGYDPVNYNVPEGSYSSDATNPSTRIVEAKEMVQGLHKSNLRVIMDVVYNHVYDASESSFNKTVPGYYFRYDSNGSLTNDSGCGNDTASERAMMRRYIVHSVTYWAKNYGVDGFRFDLMGLIDTQTMKEVRAALDKIDPSIIVLGEGWDMNTTMDKSEMSTQPNAYKLASQSVSSVSASSTGTTGLAGSTGLVKDNGVAFFNDSIRDAAKGSVFSDADTGFVSGKSGLEGLIANNLLGCRNATGTASSDLCTNGTTNVRYADAGQIVQYVEAHDNMTLYDKLRASVPTDDDATTVKRAELADSLVTLSQGIPFIQLGQEFLRTKGGDGNSYNSGDSVNAIDWDRTTTYKDSVDYVKGLLALRKNTAAFRMSSYDDISKNATILKSSDGVVAYQVKDDSGTYVVILNSASGSSATTTSSARSLASKDATTAVSGLKKGTYQVLVRDGTVLDDNDPCASADTTPTTVKVTDGDYAAASLSATVLKLETTSASSDTTGSCQTSGSDTTGDDSTGALSASDAQDGSSTTTTLSSTGSSVAWLVLAVAILSAAGIGVREASRRERRGSHSASSK